MRAVARAHRRVLDAVLRALKCRPSWPARWPCVSPQLWWCCGFQPEQSASSSFCVGHCLPQLLQEGRGGLGAGDSLKKGYLFLPQHDALAGSPIPSVTERRVLNSNTTLLAQWVSNQPKELVNPLSVQMPRRSDTVIQSTRSTNQSIHAINSGLIQPLW